MWTTPLPVSLPTHYLALLKTLERGDLAVAPDAQTPDQVRDVKTIFRSTKSETRKQIFEEYQATEANRTGGWRGDGGKGAQDKPGIQSDSVSSLSFSAGSTATEARAQKAPFRSLLGDSSIPVM